MKANAITAISSAFATKDILPKEELVRWLRTLYPAASDRTLTWRISDLKNQGILDSPGRGMYRLGEAKPFEPALSAVAKQIARLLARELPLVKSCLWETRWLNNWMQLQAPNNWIIVEVEKETLETVFHLLSTTLPKVFLDPDYKTVDLYILPLNEAVIIKPLLSESPSILIGDILSAAPEKILVDIVAEPQLFRAQQGALEDIFATAFQELQINQSKMLRYATRRRKYDAVYSLIPSDQRLVRSSKSHG